MLFFQTLLFLECCIYIVCMYCMVCKKMLYIPACIILYVNVFHSYIYLFKRIIIMLYLSLLTITYIHICIQFVWFVVFFCVYEYHINTNERGVCRHTITSIMFVFVSKYSSWRTSVGICLELCY